ncbi:MAG TPA: ATP-binding protein [Terriglobales bacterium]|nr:ATP-binding protein [Terriglobales bacterium]
MTEPMPTCEFDAGKLLVRLNVTFSAEMSAIDGVTEGVMAVAREMECAKGKEFEVETALREALANAIVHGAGGDPAKQIQCCVACDEARGMLLVVRDPGEGFDPASIPSPVVGQNVYRSHGRGIYLINQLMDKVEFAANGTEIRMVKR